MLNARYGVVAPETSTSSISSSEMNKSTLRGRWRRTKSSIIGLFYAKYQKCMLQLKKCLRQETHVETQRRKSRTQLHPLPDRPIRRVASKLQRRPTNELDRLRKKGDDWTANDLFRFQYSDPEAGEPDERKLLCEEWLKRLHRIHKKYCYLAWYASAIYACYYRLAPLLSDDTERRNVWNKVKSEYAEIFLMGRRIWRRPIHPSRLHVFYDMAMLCVRYSFVQDDDTIKLFREELNDADNFDFKVLDEVQFAESIDKIVRLENHVIGGTFGAGARRRSSARSSLRSLQRRRMEEEKERMEEERRKEEGKKAEEAEEVEIRLEKAPELEVKSIESPPIKRSVSPSSSRPIETIFEELALSVDCLTKPAEKAAFLVPTIVISPASRRNSDTSPKPNNLSTNESDEAKTKPREQ